MCGRFTLFAPVEEVETTLDAAFASAFEPTYNAAPGQSLPVVTNDEPETIQRLEWGLVPSWADDRSSFGLINARGETLDEKPSFRDAAERRRCVVPADGYYEWTESGDGRAPYRITAAEESVFAMAGLWERWTPPKRQTGLGEFGSGGNRGAAGDAPAVETFTIVTTEPNATVERVHDRMPVVLDPDQVGAWLHGDRSTRRELVSPYGGEMRAYRVSRAVNDPTNDRPSVVEPVGG